MEPKTVSDVFIGAGAITAPMWVETATAWGDLFLVIGGLILVGVRIYATLKE